MGNVVRAAAWVSRHHRDTCPGCRLADVTNDEKPRGQHRRGDQGERSGVCRPHSDTCYNQVASVDQRQPYSTRCRADSNSLSWMACAEGRSCK